MPTEMTQRQRMWSAFIRNRTALVGGVLALIVVLIAIFAPFISPFDPLEQDSYYRLMGSSSKHWLGTDDFGRDVFSRIIWGSRVSLLIGLISVGLGMFVGTAMGMVAGYFRGKVERICYPRFLRRLIKKIERKLPFKIGFYFANYSLAVLDS